MRLRNIGMNVLAAALAAGIAMTPVASMGQGRYDRDHHDRSYYQSHDRRDRSDRNHRNDRNDRYDRDHPWQGSYYRHRRDMQNQWRDIAYGAGALGVLGLLSHDNTLTFAGAAGALYSAYRMQQDIHSTDKAHRLRAEYFSHPYFYRDGVRYNRETVMRNGHKYYRFRRGH